MALDRRRQSNSPRAGVSLPDDFLAMVREVFSRHFEQPKLEVRGEVHPDEILLAVTLRAETGGIAATTVYASADFDPQASAPTAQDLLGSCVDAAGELIERVLKARQAAGPRAAEAEESVPPRRWTEIEQDGRAIFVRADAANPELDEAADAWLATHDPEREREKAREEKKRGEVIRTGPRSREDLDRALAGISKDDDDDDDGPSSATH